MRYVPLYREMHEQGQFMSNALAPWVGDIARLVKKSGAKTLLDYGSGNGNQYHVDKLHEAWGVLPTLYDPAVQGIDAKPEGQFDGVLCTDVLEHIPEDELDTVIADLAGYATQWAFIAVCCRPAKKRFPDGTNVHVTVRPLSWWRAKLEGPFEGKALLVLREAP
jgi:hypothetical protein